MLTNEMKEYVCVNALEKFKTVHCLFDQNHRLDSQLNLTTKFTHIKIMLRSGTCEFQTTP